MELLLLSQVGSVHEKSLFDVRVIEDWTAEIGALKIVNVGIFGVCIVELAKNYEYSNFIVKNLTFRKFVG
jgi:hypothetical protein